jgi:hypothetical protein
MVGDDHFCGHDEAVAGRRYLGRPPNASTRPSDAPELAREASEKAGELPPNIRDDPRRNLCPPGQDEDANGESGPWRGTRSRGKECFMLGRPWMMDGRCLL